MVFADLRLGNCMLTQILSSRGLWLYKSLIMYVLGYVCCVLGQVLKSGRLRSGMQAPSCDFTTQITFFITDISSMSNKYITHYILASLLEATSVSSLSSSNKYFVSDDQSNASKQMLVYDKIVR